MKPYKAIETFRQLLHYNKMSYTYYRVFIFIFFVLDNYYYIYSTNTQANLRKEVKNLHILMLIEEKVQI